MELEKKLINKSSKWSQSAKSKEKYDSQKLKPEWCMNKSQATQLPIHITTPPCKELITLLPIATESSSNLLRKIKTKGFKKSKELI